MRSEIHGPVYRRLKRIILTTITVHSRCVRCHRLLAEHGPHKNGKPAKWTVGHKRDNIPDWMLTLDDLGLEASTCNYAAGAAWGNTQRVESPKSVIPQAWR